MGKETNDQGLRGFAKLLNVVSAGKIIIQFIAKLIIKIYKRIKYNQQPESNQFTQFIDDKLLINIITYLIVSDLLTLIAGQKWNVTINEESYSLPAN